MRFSVSILLMVVFSTALFAQAPDTLWTKIFGGNDWDSGKSVQQTSNGGYIIVGYTQSFGAGSQDVWLIKADAVGDTLWTRTFGGSNSDEGESVQQTTDMGYIIAGSTRSFGNGSGDVWLIKTDSNGDTLWTRTFGAQSTDHGSSVQQTTDMGYVIAGSIDLFGNSGGDVWLIKTDSDGDTLWTKTFGGQSTDEGYSVQQTTDGGYIIVGYTQSFGAGFQDVWLIKTDSNGDTLWTKTFGGQSTDEGYSVQQTSDGGYIIAAATKSFGQVFADGWLIKTDANGDTLWTKIFGGSDVDWINFVQQTSEGGYIITGMTRSFGAGAFDIWLIKTNASGDTLWMNTYGGGGEDEGFSVKQTSDQGYIITGLTWSFGAGYGDLWLIKIVPGPTTIGGKIITTISDYDLRQNYPNPFNPTTTINYQLPVHVKVELSIYNLLGQRIRTLIDAAQTPGAYQVKWEGRDDAGKQVSSGIYFCRFKAGSNFSETRKMVLLR